MVDGLVLNIIYGTASSNRAIWLLRLITTGLLLVEETWAQQSCTVAGTLDYGFMSLCPVCVCEKRLILPGS